MVTVMGVTVTSLVTFEDILCVGHCNGGYSDHFIDFLPEGDIRQDLIHEAHVFQ